MFSLIKKQRGFTLIEVLIAAIVLASGLVVVIQAMGRTQQVLRISENMIAASLMAEEKLTEAQLEAIREHRLSAINLSGREKFPGREMEWRRSVKPFQDSTVQDTSKLNQVEINIRWSEGIRENVLKLISFILNHEKQL